jgi:hypothetical protein
MLPAGPRPALNRETQLHGLATTGRVVESTGIAGLTLGRRTWLVDTQVRSLARQPASRRDRRRGNASDFRLERFSKGCSVRLQADLVKSG